MMKIKYLIIIGIIITGLLIFTPGIDKKRQYSSSWFYISTGYMPGVIRSIYYKKQQYGHISTRRRFISRSK